MPISKIVSVVLEYIDHFGTHFHKCTAVGFHLSYYASIMFDTLITHYAQNYATIIGRCPLHGCCMTKPTY